MTLDQFVERVLREGVGPGDLEHRLLPGRAARLRPLPPGLDPRLAVALRARGVEALYSHQAEAYEIVTARGDCVVVTPTASGKTLCYNLPVLDRLLSEPGARALYLFPTKALAQDQRAELSDLLGDLAPAVPCHTYDGDTPPGVRTAVREAGRIVITNPDMLHAAILPHHARWVRLFENLRYVVVDEMHTYRGVFGSHLANVLRRLQRVCAFHGVSPVFVCASATIRNPGELAERLLGRPVRLIDESGAPSGPRHFFFYNPPIVHPALGVRRGCLGESVAWARRLLANDIPTIVFSRGRLQVELILSHLQRGLEPSRAAQVRGYRGGYLPRQRRAIEQGLRSGQVRAVVSTSALELGVDIGTLEAAVLSGYPGTVASAWQQAGRAGRRGGSSLVVFVAGNSPLDQYVVTHPDYLLREPPESGFVNPENLYVLMNHLKCAAFELPFREGEAFGPGPTADMLRFLAGERVLRAAGGAFHWMTDHFPASDVSLRGGDGNVVIIDRTRTGSPAVIGEIDRWSAMLTVYEEAVYLHEGTQYQVEVYDEPEGKAYVREVSVDYYTEADLAVHLKVLDVLRSDGGAPGGLGDPGSDEGEPVLAGIRGPVADAPGPDEDAAPDAAGLRGETPARLTPGSAIGRAWGEVLITAKATIFKKIKLETNENLGWGKIQLPERELHTTAYWITFPAEMEAVLGRAVLGGALAGVARALAALAPLYLLCDPADIHALPQVRGPFTGVPSIFLWEAHPGGVGLAEKAFEAHSELLRAIRERTAACPCADGCPACTGPGGQSKTAALALLRSLE